ncbi:hypothetical protein VTL71DRAFT_9721 [Oculimacula yallundae]|uniref:Uncharacterized protein n=1 Tax=Oculimacula yallundae TaxID=86028 RepID=A0ABR4BRN7_9HELO
MHESMKLLSSIDQHSCRIFAQIIHSYRQFHSNHSSPKRKEKTIIKKKIEKYQIQLNLTRLFTADPSHIKSSCPSRPRKVESSKQIPAPADPIDPCVHVISCIRKHPSIISSSNHVGSAESSLFARCKCEAKY